MKIQIDFCSVDIDITIIDENFLEILGDIKANNQRKLRQTERSLVDYRELYFGTLHSTSWKITKPLRVTGDFLKRISLFGNIFKFFYYLRHNGFRFAMYKIGTYFRRKKQNSEYSPEFLGKKERKQQENYKFSKNILISVIVPLYNTPVKFLKEMILSVQSQTYSNWELCLADGSDNDSELGKIVEKFNDKRIKYVKLEKNYGISGNSNKALEMATGDYIALCDHDDFLHPAAFFEVMRAICSQNADFIYTDEDKTDEKTGGDLQYRNFFDPHFKPDFAADSLRGINYICHLSVFKRKLIEKFDPECDGAQDYDLILRATEKARKIVHIPKVLYHWRMVKNSTAANSAAKTYTVAAAEKALAAHLERVNLEGEVIPLEIPNIFRIKYKILGEPLVSILIPNKDHFCDLEKCINSILEKTTYKNTEIIVIENNSTTSEIYKYYRKLERQNIKVVNFKEKKFNFSAINNFGRTFAKGEYLLFLNNDIEIITPDWIQEMVMFCQRKNIGAVGAKLYYPDETIQHAGVILGLGGVAGHSHKNFRRHDPGNFGKLIYAQNMTAVTAACMLVKTTVFDKIGGFDEKFAVAFNDIDLCMKIRKMGYFIVWTPFAECYHFESKSRGSDNLPQKQKRFQQEVLLFRKRYREELEKGDPYYNPNLTLSKEDYSIK